ncbi:MAG: hypothetical protein LBK26_01410 [Rickettsiales bacterium]|jgi:hypothetical protein|nr:hypothetical protein [Rickettsiales bacterium]
MKTYTIANIVGEYGNGLIVTLNDKKHSSGSIGIVLPSQKVINWRVNDELKLRYDRHGFIESFELQNSPWIYPYYVGADSTGVKIRKKSVFEPMKSFIGRLHLDFRIIKELMLCGIRPTINLAWNEIMHRNHVVPRMYMTYAYAEHAKQSR